VNTVHYSVHRLVVDTGSTLVDFRSRYEAAVPPVPVDKVAALAARQAPWSEMLDLMARAAPLGFVLYNVVDGTPVMRLAGNRGACVSYLMGNHTIAERMFRYEPSVLLYAPLHTVIWSQGDLPARFSFDKPSDQFASFGRAEITAVGRELDQKLAALLEHLGTPVPDELVSK
jgi:hypothetical protein